MDLYAVQFIFYSLGILFMVSLIAAVVALIYVMLKIKEAVERGVDLASETVTELRRNTVDKVESLLSPSHRGELLKTVGMGVAGFVAKAIRDKLTGSKR